MHTETAESSSVSSDRSVLDACLHAYRLCLETAAHAVEQDGLLDASERVQPLHDCADLCLAMANLLTRASRFCRDLAPLCSTVAQVCADALEPMEHEDPQVRATYAACCHVADVCARLTGETSPDAADARDEALAATFPASDPPPTHS